jgi:hypothetical protein
VLQKALETLLASARSIEEAQDKIEFWFNSRMEQLSETYKKNIQYMSLIIGALLVILLNVDTLFVARALWDDPAVRETLVATARTQLESGQLEQAITDSQSSLEQAQATPEATSEPTSQGETTEASDAVNESAQQVQETVQSLLDLRLPIGWEFTALTNGCQGNTVENPCTNLRNLWNMGPANNPDWFVFLIRKIVGWVITVIAIAQGAPFWFDLLNRIARGRQ